MWHGLIIDTWRDVLRSKKKERGFSNAYIAEKALLSEGAVARLFTDRSDPPISHIVAVSAVLDVPVDELFAPARPNGRRARDLLEDDARISQENADLREETARLKALVDNLKDELLDFYRKSKVTG